MSNPLDYQGPGSTPPPQYQPGAPVVVIPPPIATWVLAGAIVAMYVVTAIGAMQQGKDPFNLEAGYLAVCGGLYAEPVLRGEYWRLISYAFLHGGIWHILMNTIALVNVGTLVEAWQGKTRLVTIFFVTAVTSALVALFFNPNIVTIGASGAIFGLLGAIIAMLIRHGKHLPEAVRGHLWSSMSRVLVINLVISLIPGISWAGHLGGFVGGLLLGLIITVPPGQFKRRPPEQQGWQ